MNKIQKAYTTKRLILKEYQEPDLVFTKYSILLKSSKQEIGEVTICYDGEIWYTIEKPFRKKGYATEAVSKLIKKSNRNRFYLLIHNSNIASKKVAQKLGFKCEEKDGKILTFVKTKNKLKDSCTKM